MHSRDFAALALSLLAIHLSLSHDGPVSLRKVRERVECGGREKARGSLPARRSVPRSLVLLPPPHPLPHHFQAWFHHTPPDTASALDGSPPYIPPAP